MFCPGELHVENQIIQEVIPLILIDFDLFLIKIFYVCRIFHPMLTILYYLAFHDSSR